MINTNSNYPPTTAQDQLKIRNILDKKNPQNETESLEFLRSLTSSQLKELTVQHKENAEHIRNNLKRCVVVTSLALATLAGLAVLIATPATWALGAGVLGVGCTVVVALVAIISVGSCLEMGADLKEEKCRLDAVRTINIKSDAKPTGFTYKNYLWKNFNLSTLRLVDKRVLDCFPRRMPKESSHLMLASKV